MPIIVAYFPVFNYFIDTGKNCIQAAGGEAELFACEERL